MRSGSRTTGFAWLLAGGAALVGLIFLASTLAFLRENHGPGPAVDFWHFMKLLQRRAGEGDWLPLLVREHGGHRLLFPRLLYLAEYEWFRGRNVFLVGSSLLLQAGTAALLIAGVWRERSQRAWPLPVFCSGLIVALLFSGAQIENFMRAWNLHWFLVFAAAAAAFAAESQATAARTAERRGAAIAWLAASLSAGLVATWTMANGLLVWPILLVLAWVLRLPGSWLLALALLAAAGAASFFVGYEPHRNVEPERLLTQPGVQLLWLARALGTPLASGGTAAGLCGGLALAAGAALGLDFARRRGRGPAAEPLLVGLMLFAAGTALLAATGRAADTWNEPRYQTAVLVYWLCLLLWALLRAGAMGGAWRLGSLSACLLWLVTLGAAEHRQGLWEGQAYAERIRKANLAIVVGIDHPPSYEATLPFADRLRKRDRVQRFAPGLRRREQGMFADGRHALLGARIGTDLALAPAAACGGEVQEIVPLVHPKNGRRVGTWVRGVARLAGEDGLPESLLVSGEDGVVIGLGEGLRFDRWDAFVGPLPAGTLATLYARLPDGAVCRITDFQPGG